jgi:hypothetical protein
VTPRAVVSPLTYFQDKVAGRPNAGALPGNLQKSAQGYMEHLEGGQWRSVWNAPLVNEVAPVSVVVSNSGLTATFDNWFSMGYGQSVVVIYDGRGQKVRNLSLGDFLTRAYIHAMPRTVSSIDWGKGHYFSDDGKQLILRIVVPPDPSIDPMQGEMQYVEMAVNAATGQVIAPSGPKWDAALQAATLADARLRAEEASEDAAFKAPLLPPSSEEDPQWHGYLVEAFFRVDPDWKDDYPQTVVLGYKGSKYYKRDLKFLRDALTQPLDSDGPIMLGSPDPGNLIREIGRITSSMSRKRLSKARVYVTVTPGFIDVAASAIARTGAKFIPLDMSKGIAQNPDRLKTYLSSHKEDDQR